MGVATNGAGSAGPAGDETTGAIGSGASRPGSKATEASEPAGNALAVNSSVLESVVRCGLFEAAGLPPGLTVASAALSADGTGCSERMGNWNKSAAAAISIQPPLYAGASAKTVEAVRERRVVAGSASSNGRSVSNGTANGPRTLVPYGPDTAGHHKISAGSI